MPFIVSGYSIATIKQMETLAAKFSKWIKQTTRSTPRIIFIRYQCQWESLLVTRDGRKKIQLLWAEKKAATIGLKRRNFEIKAISANEKMWMVQSSDIVMSGLWIGGLAEGFPVVTGPIANDAWKGCKEEQRLLLPPFSERKETLKDLSYESPLLLKSKAKKYEKITMNAILWIS